MSDTDREWWAAESNRPTEAEENAARLDAHYALLFEQWLARERHGLGLDV